MVNLVKGQIRQSLSGYYDVMGEDGVEYRTRARGNFRKKGQTPLVGDMVELKAEKVDQGYLLKIYPRKNQLVRPPVANIDTAVVVTAVREPDFAANLLDRQLLMLENHGIRPVLYFSKCDLLSEDEVNEFAELAAYYDRYYHTYMSNQDQVVDSLMADLKGEVVVFMGQTGAGKSTLLNAIEPDLQLETGEISKALSRGRHTTRKVTLIPIRESLLADTPGFSSFELLDVTVTDLPTLYPEFRQYQAGCKYRGCLHLKEPKCAVKEAVAAGEILQSRYDNYCQLNELLVNQKPKYR